MANAASVHELLTAVSVFAEQEGRSLFFLTMAAGIIVRAKIRGALQGRRYTMKIMTPEFIDNVNKTLCQSLKDEIKPGSKVSIAAACFSIYAYQELQNELKNIDELRFILLRFIISSKNSWMILAKMFYQKKLLDLSRAQSGISFITSSRMPVLQL